MSLVLRFFCGRAWTGRRRVVVVSAETRGTGRVWGGAFSPGFGSVGVRPHASVGLKTGIYRKIRRLFVLVLRWLCFLFEVRVQRIICSALAALIERVEVYKPGIPIFMARLAPGS